MAENDENTNNTTSPIKTYAKAALLGFFATVAYRFIRPFYHFYKIRNWLNSESEYVHDYTRDLKWYGDFEFQVQLGGPEGPELEIENVFLNAPVQIRAVKEFEPDVLLYLTEEPDDETIVGGPGQSRRQFVMMMETVLTTLPGHFVYRNKDGEVVPFEQSKEVAIEYRLDPDGLSQHELMNGIISMVNGMRYISRREDALKEELTESR